MSQQVTAALTRHGCEVHKFGGSSLASASRFQAVSRIVQQQAGLPWVVVSAPGDTTDALLAIISRYQHAEDISLPLARLTTALQQLVSDTLAAQHAAIVLTTLSGWLQQIPDWLASEQINEVLAIGELLSASLLAALLTEQGKPAQAIDARDFLVFNGGEPDWQQSTTRFSRLIAGTQSTQCHIITGFIGRDEKGGSITLGRNGSDYSATLVGALLGAQRVSIWTDVTAIYSADPRKCTSAVAYQQVNKRQACQLAALGNPVLHARTLSPLSGTATHLLVRSALQPEYAGCAVEPEAPNQAFLTSLNPVRLVSLAGRSQIDADALARELQSAVVVLPHADNADNADHASGQCWLIPSDVWPDAATKLQQQGCHPLADTIDYYALVWLKAGKQQQVSAALAHYLQQLQVRHLYENDQLAVWLFKQELAVAELNQIHQHCVVSKPSLQLLVAGTGNVGAEFLAMLAQQQQALAEDITLELAGVFNTRQAWLGARLNPTLWQEQLATANRYSTAELLDYIQKLPAPKVLVDITPSQQFARQYPQFVAAGCHIISANKQGVTLPLTEYRSIRSAAAKAQLSWRSNTTVGAGIPVQQVIKTLLQSGDNISRISGIFSGTLSWLLCKYDGSVPFSSLLSQAAELGYTEPDPRDDLSGIDVQRKLLVLARELGLSLELAHISLQPLMPEALRAGSWADAWQRRELLDNMLASALADAKAAGKLLRYAASLTLSDSGAKAEVKLLQVASDEPLAALAPCDNIFVIESQWYSANPLVLKGPGAGKQVTAGGIHADVAQLCQQLILTGASR
ncbi:MAG: homoserine dehydrogenase [Rheinheimera sp.]|uniref:bifunctional aspartate kinase/homoserine dehydrogenase II n=1 Tax=Arsukibacterium sp. UBA3155 TaxID=1946058 RepID=UPI000C93782E|nr:bifunctional aspartate kinase/homoserine dehydrogenase II [Arsukibacterium sp. UBA3155]MAD76280.1 homoserine dehydrogenase [Rheinheimera sp.]|tara:strand:+ start:32853 stop:35255 length:2403 start_codon:yes stop_codon:yes gene_type:complete